MKSLFKCHRSRGVVEHSKKILYTLVWLPLYKLFSPTSDSSCVDHRIRLTKKRSRYTDLLRRRDVALLRYVKQQVENYIFYTSVVIVYSLEDQNVAFSKQMLISMASKIILVICLISASSYLISCSPVTVSITVAVWHFGNAAFRSVLFSVHRNCHLRRN